MRMINLKSKKGAEEIGGNVIGWLVVVILLALLVWAIYFFIFKGGFGGISQFQKSEIENVRAACNTACASSLDYDYCKMIRTITLSKDDFSEFSSDFKDDKDTSITNDPKKGIVTASCAWLEKSPIAEKWIISPCNNIDCNA